MAWKRLWLVFVGALALLFSAHAKAEPTDFSKQVTALTGDWVAEDWKEGWIKLHPEKYTWQSDYYMELVAEEPVLERNAQEALIKKYDVITREKVPFDSREAKQVFSGAWAFGGHWIDSYGDRNISLWGVITTAANSFVFFSANCQPGKGRGAESDACVAKISKIMELLQSRSLVLPEPPVPLTVSGWKGQYDNSGVSTLTNSNYNSTVTAIIRVSPPLNIPADSLQNVIEEFGQALWDDLVTGASKTPSAQRWVGTTTDPWLRTTFPNTIETENESTVMAGSVKIADGRTVLLSVSCPYIGWQSTCARGIEQSKLFLTSGIVEQRRQKIIVANSKPLPVNGLKNSDILGIYGTYSTHGGVTLSYDGNYFLKNGQVFNGADDAPAMIDPVVSQKSNPESWGRWTRKGSEMHVVWGDGGTDDISATQDNLQIGGPKGMRLEGYYGSISSSGSLITNTGFVNRSGYTFNADGTFTSSSSNMFSVGGFVADNILPVQIAAGGGGSKSAKARYEIDGYMITFFYPDGQISRRAFAMNAKDANNPKRETIYIDGSAQTLNGGE